MELAGVLAVAGFLLLVIGTAMLLPMGISLLYQEPVWSAFLIGAVITWLIGGVMFFLFYNKEQRQLRPREGLAVVGISWIVAVLMCSLPLFFSGEFPSFVDALFEASSGLTSTGATIMRDVEAASHGILFWRSMTHWLGGMGFIVLSLAVFPFLGLGGMQLYKAEIPSPNPERLQPRIKDTASMLWRIYLSLTLLAWLLFWLAGMNSFDAICHAMSNLASGGFSTKNDSIGAFNSPLIEWLAILFMMASGLNYALYFWLLRGKPVWRDEEMRYYLGIIVTVAVIITLILTLTSKLGFSEALRQSFFHVTALITTTGFATIDYVQWPSAAVAFLLLVMFLGGSAGSTSGGPKVLRLLIFIKFAVNELRVIIHPRSVTAIKINKRPVEREVFSAVCAFLGLYFLCIFLSTLALSLTGLNLETAFSASLACQGNIGPGLGNVGPATTYADLPSLAKCLLSFTMVAGRLEIFPVLVLFMPSLWRR